jgi:hypothetical protein
MVDCPAERQDESITELERPMLVPQLPPTDANLTCSRVEQLFHRRGIGEQHTGPILLDTFE